MKRLFLGFVMISLMSLIFHSCMDSGKRKSAVDSKEVKDSPTRNNENTYEPDQDWKLVWSDEFDVDSIDKSNWNFQVVEAGHFNDEWQRYTNNNKNAYIEDGCLIIEANHESDIHGMDHYTSARLNTANKQTWKYGKIMARMKLPQGHGIWPAFWMLGANIDENGGDTPWPQCGEVDILELYGTKDDAVIEANKHYAKESGAHDMMGAVSYELEEGIFADEFHVFELEWNKDRLAWFVDGKEYASSPIIAKDQSEFHNEFFIVLNVAVGGTWAGRPDSTTVFPQQMLIDWVKVYQK